MKNLVIIFAFHLIFSSGFSQELKPLSVYEASLKQYVQSMWKANREEFRDMNRKPFWNYVPDVGFAWGLPIVHWRLSNIFQYRRDKFLLERKLKSLDMKSEIDLNQQMQVLGIEYDKLKLELERIKIAEEKFRIEEAIYAIGVECCQKRECTPEQCRVKDLERFESSERIRILKIDFQILVLETEKLAHFGVKNLHLKL
jgi:hypothetical protein